MPLRIEIDKPSLIVMNTQGSCYLGIFIEFKYLVAPNSGKESTTSFSCCGYLIT